MSAWGNIEKLNSSNNDSTTYIDEPIKVNFEYEARRNQNDFK